MIEMMTEHIDIRRNGKDDYNVGFAYTFHGISMADVELLSQVIQGAIDGLPRKLIMTAGELDEAIV